MPDPGSTGDIGEVRKLIFGHLNAQIAGAMARLAIPEKLAAGPMPAADLAAACGAEPGALLRLLRAASALGLVAETSGETFSVTPMGALLGPGEPTLRDLAMALTGPGHWGPVGRLCDSILSGRPAVHDVLGKGLWDYYRDNPQEGEVFSAAMRNISEPAGVELAAAIDVPPGTRIVDVAGGHGALLAGLLRAFPESSGVLFDLPEVLAGAAGFLEESGVAGRVELVPGSFFDSVPRGGDLYLLKHILHDWDDAGAAAILGRCREACEAGARLIVVERLMDSVADPVAFQADLLMLVILGGRERTRTEYEEMLTSAGFRPQALHQLSMLRALEAAAV